MALTEEQLLSAKELMGLEDAYGAQTFARLQAAKRTWDPGNLFRHNHNIPPAP